jgi:cytochrome b561
MIVVPRYKIQLRVSTVVRLYGSTAVQLYYLDSVRVRARTVQNTRQVWVRSQLGFPVWHIPAVYFRLFYKKDGTLSR